MKKILYTFIASLIIAFSTFGQAPYPSKVNLKFNQWYDYNAMTVKKSVSGSGRADKTQMSRVVQMLVGQEVHAPHDATDAIAIAITHIAHAAHHAAMEKLA